MQLDTDAVCVARVQRRKPAGIGRRGVGRMMGSCPRGLEPGDVGEIGKFARRFEGGDEVRKLVAIGCKHGRARRLLQHEAVRHRREKFSPTIFSTTGKRLSSTFTRPATTLLR